MGADAAVLEPVPEALRVFKGIDFDLSFGVARALEHQKLSKQLVGVGDSIFLNVALGQLLDSGGTNSWDSAQVGIGGSVSPVFHGVIGHLGLFGVISVSLTETETKKIHK